MFTRKSTFKDVMACPGLSKYQKYYFDAPIEGLPSMSPPPEVLMETTFEALCGQVSPAWNPDAMAEGFEMLAELEAAGQLKDLPIYSETELAEDRTKERAALMYIPAKTKGAFALVCAGGSYMTVACIVEAFPVAKRLHELDIPVFVLRYRAGVKNAVPRSIEDSHRAITYIIDHAEEFGVEKDYAAFGFSAGGHLVASLGTDNHGYRSANLPKPSMLAMGYPLVDFTEYLQIGSHIAATLPVMFDVPDPYSIMDEYTPVKHVGKDFPKSYIWQTVEDELVPYTSNGLKLHQLLKDQQIICKLKEVAHGNHGLGAGKDSEAEGWIDEAVAFWKENK